MRYFLITYQDIDKKPLAVHDDGKPNPEFWMAATNGMDRIREITEEEFKERKSQE